MNHLSLTRKEWAGLLGVIAHQISNNQIQYLYHESIRSASPTIRLEVKRLFKRYVELSEDLSETDPIIFWESMYIILLILTSKSYAKHTGIIPDLNVYSDRHSWEILKTPTYIGKVLKAIQDMHPYGIISTSTFSYLKNLKGNHLIDVPPMIAELEQQIKGHVQSRT